MANSALPLERFEALEALGIPHAFIGRVPGVPLSNDKAEILRALDSAHRAASAEAGLSNRIFVTAGQVHGCEIAVIDSKLEGERCFAGCDGLLTNQRNVCLGIYVADCCAVYLADREKRAIALVHSGRRGTELGIVSNAIRKMQERFEVAPQDLVMQLSPCIRPPHYEVDFAAAIRTQAEAAGVKEVHDCGLCTACDLAHYYSYRAEKGRTGRMLALLALPA